MKTTIKNCEICKKSHSSICQHYNKGKTPKVALVFSCPGANEEKQGMPVCGTTGERVEELLRNLRSKGVFTTYECRYDFRITNAHSEAKYKTSRDPNAPTEPTLKEIEQSGNIDRLYKELKDTITTNGLIICFGKKAFYAVKKMIEAEITKPQSVNVIETHHPSPRNSRYPLKVIQEDIKNQLKKTTKKPNI